MSILNYYLEVNASLIIIIAGYLLFLNKQSHFNFNRAYLLIGIAAAVLFPLIKIQSNIAFFPVIGKSFATYMLPELLIDSNKPFESNIIEINLASIFLWVYFSIAAILLFTLSYKVSRLLIKSWKSNRFTRIENFKVIETKEGFTSFSFFNLIFIGNAYLLEERKQVIAHELVHGRNLHSVDILLTELLKIFFWFNPAVYLIKNKFISLHEFQADKVAVENCDVNQYCNLLARVALQSADYPIANHFNNSLTFKRITMIKNATGRLQWWRVSSSIAIIVGLFVFVSCKEKNNTTEKISPSNEVFSIVEESASPAKEGVPIEKLSPSDEIFSVVEENASPANGMVEFYDFIGNNLLYPEQARKAGIEGKVLVQFVINKDGSLSDVTVLKGIGAGCDRAAMDVISSAPKWKPGKQSGLIVRQRYTLPIIFKLG